MLALTYEGVINDQSEQGSLFPADRVLPSRKRDGKSREGFGRARSCWREDAQKDGTHLEQGSPQTDRGRAKTTLGESTEASRQASQVVIAVISQAPQMASFANFS